MPKDVNTDDYRPNKPIHDEPVSFGKWSWTGRVTMTVGETAQTLCERAMVTDATEAASPRLAAFIVSCKPLEFTSLFDIGDIRAFLPAFQPHQYARLFAEGPDGENLAVFSEFMARKQRAVLFPALWDEKLVGCLLFVSSSSKYLLKELEVPKELYADTPCLIAILFVGNSDVPAIQEHYRHLLPPMQRTVERAVLSHEQWRRSIREEKGYHLALHIIQLPVDVREFLYNHPSTVWCKIPDDGDADGREDQETKLLRRILRKSKVGSVAPEDLPAETHTVFVHAGALRNIHNLPHLMQRRLRPDVRFCLYGTHETVHLSRWGFREIYLLGGVVTFTPEALVDDAWAVLRTIRDINAHPLWACYLLPQVLGLAHKLSQTREDETAEYRDSLPYTLDQLCKAIHKGQVSLMHTPVNDSDEQISRWVVDRVLLRPQTTQAVLDCSIKAFEEAYASEPPASWGTLAKNDVLADMRRMQVQPIMVDQYRRFVVLDSSSNLSRYKPVDGVEWDGVGQFSFRDNFKWEPRC
ncbi:hypothetical protein C8F04DRAFT_315536 [Mycena alexandri]|uniref:Uncharacterized protein n=1 Tax=Mycena alexandri TaxID=1745969 RepID=A0AAD6T486_9AGAR|nr:hypothetical protein C8F04DRAFT_315536 [Mycena alexandri]